MYEGICEFCKKPYKGWGKYYCSYSCRSKGDQLVQDTIKQARKIRWQNDKKRGQYFKCLFCGKEFWVYPYKIKLGEGKYCSKTCANRSNAGKLSENRKGSKNPRYGKKPWNYIDGKRSHYYIKSQWREIARKIRKRDNYKCRRCGNFAYLVHHIISRRKHGTDMDKNLIILCRKCHNQLHAGLWIWKGGGVHETC